MLKFFPRELWGVLDSKYSTASMNELARRKKVKLDERKKLSKLDAVATAEDGDEKGSDVDDVVEDGDEEGGAKSDHDDEFEEDEDDMVGDYNAEQYFDDGGDDAGDDYDGGDGGGDDGMY